MEGVDETGVEELWGPEAGEEGGDVLLGGDPPNLDIMILDQPEKNTAMNCGSQLLLLTTLIRPLQY